MANYENDFNDGEYDDTHEQDVDNDDFTVANPSQFSGRGLLSSFVSSPTWSSFIPLGNKSVTFSAILSIQWLLQMTITMLLMGAMMLYPYLVIQTEKLISQDVNS
jgi:hypothetical protein